MQEFISIGRRSFSPNGKDRRGKVNKRKEETREKSLTRNSNEVRILQALKCRYMNKKIEESNTNNTNSRLIHIPLKLMLLTWFESKSQYITRQIPHEHCLFTFHSCSRFGTVHVDADNSGDDGCDYAHLLCLTRHPRLPLSK